MSQQKQLVLEFYVETYAENAVREAIAKEGIKNELKLLRTREKTNREQIERLSKDVNKLSRLLREATSQIEQIKAWHREDVDAADWWKNGSAEEDPEA